MAKLMTIDEMMQDVFGDLGSSSACMYNRIQYSIVTALFDYRMENKLSQTKLAKQLGITQSMVSKLESGDYNMSLKTICDVFFKLKMKVNFEINNKDEFLHNDFFKLHTADINLPISTKGQAKNYGDAA